MASTGQGWEQIRAEWDIPRIAAWNKYAADNPPVHLMVAAYLGIKRKGAPPTSDLVTDLATMPGGMELSVHPRPIRRDLMPWLKKTST